MASTNTETGVPADGHGSGTFPPFDSSTYPSQLLWLAITFGLLYYLMSRVALPRISEILETRSGRIAQDIEEVNRLKDESDQAIAAYEQELAQAKSRAHTIAQDARDAGKKEQDAKRAKVEADLAAKLAESEKQIAAIKEKAMGEVGTIAEDTTEALVSQLIGGKVSKADISSAIKSVKG